jgi:hydroxymethylglutaryl-CoA lyase
MNDFPKRVIVNEDGPREGFQIESAIISTAAKIELIDALSRTGIKEIQVASFVSPRRVPQWADADAVVAGLTPRQGVSYTGLYLNQRGLERAIATGKLHIEGGISLCASAAFLARNQQATPEQQKQTRRDMVRLLLANNVPVTGASVSAAFGCNFQGDISTQHVLATLKDVFAIAREFDLKLKTIGLSDTMAWATPARIKTTIAAIRNRYPDMGLSLHLHDTRGLAVANAYAGLEMGVDSFDSSIGGLGGCPFAAHKGAAGNLCTEDFVFMCEEMGVETGIDLDKLIEASDVAEGIVGHPLPGSVRRGGTLAALRRSLREGVHA